MLRVRAVSVGAQREDCLGEIPCVARSAQRFACSSRQSWLHELPTRQLEGLLANTLLANAPSQSVKQSVTQSDGRTASRTNGCLV